MSSNRSLDANMKAPTVVESPKVPGEVVALTRYRGLQLSSSYLRQGESLLHVIGEGKRECQGSRWTIQGTYGPL